VDCPPLCFRRLQFDRFRRTAGVAIRPPPLLAAMRSCGLRERARFARYPTPLQSPPFANPLPPFWLLHDDMVLRTSIHPVALLDWFSFPDDQFSSFPDEPFPVSTVSSFLGRYITPSPSHRHVACSLDLFILPFAVRPLAVRPLAVRPLLHRHDRQT
jgi:hypothetical protein